MEASYDALRKTQLQERKNPALASVDASFYADYRALLARLQEKFQKGGGSGIEEGKELANTESVLRDVMEAREQKIVFKALRDARAGSVRPEGLAAEEKQLYLSLVEIINDFESRAANHSRALKEVADEEKPANRKAKFVKDLPALAWRDGSTQGPFKTGDVLELDREFAEFLRGKQVVEFV